MKELNPANFSTFKKSPVDERRHLAPLDQEKVDEFMSMGIDEMAAYHKENPIKFQEYGDTFLVLDQPEFVYAAWQLGIVAIVGEELELMSFDPGKELLPIDEWEALGPAEYAEYQALLEV